MYLTPQADGNLVLYQSNGSPIFGAASSGTGPFHLIMQSVSSSA